MTPKFIRFVLMVIALVLFSWLGGLDVPKWIFWPVLGIYACGFFGGMAAALENK
jgi:hypothetical protein